MHAQLLCIYSYINLRNMKKCCPSTTHLEFPNKGNHVRHALCQVLKHGDEPSHCDSSFPCYYRVACCLHYALCYKN